tara:strand:+ start:1717 stop:1923 length:207 start_codon:yes stop_codon:yes gene_type:complete
MSRGFALRHTPLALALHLGLGLCTGANLAQAQTQASSVQTFNIPAGNLDQVLNQFALDAGIELYLDAN